MPFWNKVTNPGTSLPLARRPACFHQRRRLAVDGCSLAIGVGEIVKRIEHLHLVESGIAAVPAFLAVALRRRWSEPLDVKLAIAEFAARKNVAARQRFHVSVATTSLLPTIYDARVPVMPPAGGKLERIQFLLDHVSVQNKPQRDISGVPTEQSDILPGPQYSMDLRGRSR
jgi:hypothetical protein